MLSRRFDVHEDQCLMSHPGNHWPKRDASREELVESIFGILDSPLRRSWMGERSLRRQVQALDSASLRIYAQDINLCIEPHSVAGQRTWKMKIIEFSMRVHFHEVDVGTSVSCGGDRFRVER